MVSFAHILVQVSNFNSSFSDGRALCYLIHHYHPQLLTLDSIKDDTTLTQVCINLVCEWVDVHVMYIYIFDYVFNSNNITCDVYLCTYTCIYIFDYVLYSKISQLMCTCAHKHVSVLIGQKNKSYIMNVRLS